MNTKEIPGSFGTEYDEVLAANVALHSRMAKDYNTVEPHFRPENVSRVEDRLRAVCQRAGSARRLLDLGCGTGFMIQIARNMVAGIDGVDATAAMLAVVDRSGPAQIRLFEGDTGSYPVEQGSYDVVTAYSFLHHLYDIRPTLATARRALRTGGVFYVDLDPNYYFWEAIKDLAPDAKYDPIVTREIAAVTAKDEEIAGKFGVTKETFNQAEYQKAIAGGFKEEDLIRDLKAAGFTDIDIHYYWFVGQGPLLNAPGIDRAVSEQNAQLVEALLNRALPISRTLFKYVGFSATAA